jgi:hypothetical protein
MELAKKNNANRENDHPKRNRREILPVKVE